MSVISGAITADEYAAAAAIHRYAMVHGLACAIEQAYRNSGGVSTPADYRHFGSLVEQIGRSGVSEKRQGKHLQQLGVCAAHYFAVRGSNDTHPDKPLVDMLFELGARREHKDQSYHVAESEEAREFADTLSVLRLVAAAGVTFDEIHENPRIAAEIVDKVTSDIGRPVKTSHAMAILRDIRRWGSVADWIPHEAVEQTREAIQAPRMREVQGALRRRSVPALKAFHIYAHHFKGPRRETRHTQEGFVS